MASVLMCLFRTVDGSFLQDLITNMNWSFEITQNQNYFEAGTSKGQLFTSKVIQTVQKTDRTEHNGTSIAFMCMCVGPKSHFQNLITAWIQNQERFLQCLHFVILSAVFLSLLNPFQQSRAIELLCMSYITADSDPFIPNRYIQELPPSLWLCRRCWNSRNNDENCHSFQVLLFKIYCNQQYETECLLLHYIEQLLCAVLC